MARKHLRRTAGVLLFWLLSAALGATAAQAAHWSHYGWRDEHQGYTSRPSGQTALINTFGSACDSNASFNRNITLQAQLPSGAVDSYLLVYHKKLGGNNATGASTDDFRVRAAYASVRPDRQRIDCTDTGIADAVAHLPELAQVSTQQLEISCGSGDSLYLHLDTQLVRVLPEPRAGGAGGLLPPATCAPEARCLGAAAQILGPGAALPAHQWMTVSAFRTRAGAEQFITWMRDAGSGVPALVVQAVRSTGTSNIGLGQEPSPDGSGPVQEPLPEQESFQQ